LNRQAGLHKGGTNLTVAEAKNFRKGSWVCWLRVPEGPVERPEIDRTAQLGEFCDIRDLARRKRVAIKR
jgi:hypothetical protein